VFPRFESAELARAYPDFFHESPHNLFLDAATAQGIPGLIVLVAACALGYFAARRAMASHQMLTGTLAAGLTAIIVTHQFTSFIVPTMLDFWLLVAILVAVDSPALPVGSRLRTSYAFMGAALVCAAFLATYAWRITMSDYELGRARASLESSRIQDARRHYERAEELNPRGAIADLWYSRAMALAAKKSPEILVRLAAWQAAFEAARRAVQTSEEPHNAWYNLAAFYATQNDFGRTEQSLRRSIESSPNWFKPHWMLAQVLREAGRRDEALAEAQRSVELNGGKNPEVEATLDQLHKQH